MKLSKRKRKIAPAATSVAKPAALVANADSSAHSATLDRSTQPTGSAKPAADYALTSNCTIQEGAALKAALLNLEESPRTIVLDVHAVERIDTAALQLLCAFVRDRRSRGRRTEWTGAAPTFTEAVEILGLTQALGFTAEKFA